MTLSDSEIRHLAITLLTAPTARDLQTRIGASDLSNGCDYCLGKSLLGIKTESDASKRVWMGRTLGTATHLVMDDRVKQLRDSFSALADSESEKHVVFASIEGYGEVGGSIDLLLALVDADPALQLPVNIGDGIVVMMSPGQILDWKGSTRKKSCLMIDFLQIQQGKPAIYGRTHKDVKLSEKEYAAAMAEQAYKVTGYYGQQNLYMLSGAARHAALVFFNRDGTGFFDVPHLSRYEDETAVHDVWVMSFEFNEAYALELVARGQRIFDLLTKDGGSLADLHRHEHCWPCSMEPAEAVTVVPMDDTVVPLDQVAIDIEFAAITEANFPAN